MAINNFSSNLVYFDVDGRVITDWGQTDPPLVISPNNPAGTLIRGNGANGVILFAINQIYTFTISLNPGSIDSAFMQGKFNAKLPVVMGYSIGGTLEGAIALQGAIVNVGDTGRAGMTSITDDVYIAEMLVLTQTKGGN